MIESVVDANMTKRTDGLTICLVLKSNSFMSLGLIPIEPLQRLAESIGSVKSIPSHHTVRMYTNQRIVRSKRQWRIDRILERIDWSL